MTLPPRPPLVPEDVGRNGAAKTKSIARALASVALGSLLRESPTKIVERSWPSDHMAGTFTRAATSPTTTAAAPDLATSLTASILAGIAPQSAAVRFFANCVRLDFRGIHEFHIPGASSVPAPVFIGEGNPIPVGAGTIAPVLIGPVRKMAVATAVTQELEFATPESATTIISRLLSEQAGKSLDAVVFDNVAASATRPAGLLNGVSPISATVGGGLGALAGDLAAIADAIATAGGNTDNIVFVANPREAIKLRLLASPSFNYTIIGCAALADGTIVGLAADAIATGFDGLPQIDVSKAATVQFEDTSPADIVSGGAVAGTVKSAWQSDLLFLRLRLKCCWGPLATGMVQVVNSVTW